ncbi:hypothetical protein MMC18_004170 [Xylographa bjoerkii]|nr:hypothetical protein [Xylographa bjoerkii]
MDRIRNVYPSKPLRSAQHEIRLLELLPGDSGSKICGRLIHRSIEDSKRTYDALSYAWGDPTTTTAITLGSNESFHISTRLAAALQDLRHLDRPHFAWIDAICINQDSVQERNAQVRMMNRIFKGASCVRIWLDMELDPENDAISRLKLLGNATETDALGNDPHFWIPVSEIFENPYWKRIWIQQEIRNATRCEIQCRGTILPMSCLRQYILLVNNKLLEPGLYLSPWRNLKLAINGTMDCGSTSGSIFSSTPNGLLETLDSCRYLQCADERDRVFGLVTLVKGYNEGDMPIDYQLSVTEVYVNVVRYVLLKDKSLDFLLFACLRDGEIGQIFPSWVPDWSTQSRSYIPRDHYTNSLTCDVLCINTPQISNCGRVLRVQGIQIDHTYVLLQTLKDRHFTDKPMPDLRGISMNILECSIRQSGLLLQNHSQDDFETLPHFRALVRALLRIDAFDFTNSSHYEQYLLDNYESAKLLLGESRGSNSILRKEISLFELLFSVADLILDEHTELSHWLVGLILALWWRNPLVGSTGFISVEPNNAKLDDEIWILFGCTWPVTLRRQGDHYLVVGKAFMDGWIRGEWVKDVPAQVKDGDCVAGRTVRTIDLH